MGGNLVKLIFSCISTGSGWADLRKNAAESLKNMGQLSGALNAVAVHAGTMGGAIGRALSAFAMGNVWGIAAVGVSNIIDKLGIFKDKADDTKEKLDKLEESTRKFYETINSNSQKSLEKIDKETKRRNEQLDITNRMIKAELQLQKARAISSGDTKGVERIDRQIAEQDQTTSMSKAVATERAAAAKYRTAEGGLDAARKQVFQIRKEVDDVKDRIFYQHWDQVRGNAEANFKGAFGPNARFDDSALWNDFRKKFRYSEDETKTINAAMERLALAEKNLEAQHKVTDEARESYKVARDNVKALKAEQEAADAETKAKARAKVQEDLKRMKKKADDELAAWKKAEAERIKKEEEDEKTYQANKKKAEIEAIQKEVEKANEARKKALQDDIEANSKRASDLQQKLSDATARANAAHDVLGNAAGMDQGGGVSAKRREWMNNTRFANGAIDLIGSGKIRRGPNGEWVANGRLSNLNQAILDRLNADENKRKLEKENDKVVRKLDELKKAIEQMSTL